MLQINKAQKFITEVFNGWTALCIRDGGIVSLSGNDNKYGGKNYQCYKDGKIINYIM